MIAVLLLRQVLFEFKGDKSVDRGAGFWFGKIRLKEENGVVGVWGEFEFISRVGRYDNHCAQIWNEKRVTMQM